MSNTQEFIGRVIDRLGVAMDRWVEEAGESRYITESLDGAINAAIDVTAGEAGPISAKIGEMAVIYTEWSDALAKAGQSASIKLQFPEEPFFELLFEVITLRSEEKLPKSTKFESIKELIDQGVNYAQICRIYGFRDYKGDEDLDMLREEIATPGIHTKDRLSPGEEAIAKRKAANIDRIEVWKAGIEGKKPNAKPAPESILALAGQGVCISQILLMHPDKTEESIIAECEAEGVPVPPKEYTNPAHGVGVYDTEPSEARQRVIDAKTGKDTPEPANDPVAVEDSVPEMTVVDEGPDFADPNTKSDRERIIACHREGLDKDEIMEYLKDEGLEVSLRKVAYHVRTAEKPRTDDPATEG